MLGIVHIYQYQESKGLLYYCLKGYDSLIPLTQALRLTQGRIFRFSCGGGGGGAQNLGGCIANFSYFEVSKTCSSAFCFYFSFYFQSFTTNYYRNVETKQHHFDDLVWSMNILSSISLILKIIDEFRVLQLFENYDYTIYIT